MKANQEGSRLGPRALAILFTLLLIAAIALSMTGFHVSWGRLPEPMDAVMGCTLLAPLALPKAFGDILHFTEPISTRGVVPMAIGFWATIGLLLWLALRRRSIGALLMIAAMVLVGAWNWQVVANAMIGL